MDLRWKPLVHSASLVDIPIMTVSYDAVALERWIAAYEPWIQSKRNKSKRYRYSIFREYAELARGGRFVLPFAGEAAKRRFNELHTGLLLHGKGFFCWGGVHLFYPRSGCAPKGGKTEIDTTEEVRSRLPWQWPSEIQGTLDFQPKNPDIVAYSKKLNKWAFCEAKGPGEGIHPEQLKALAALLLLTGAPVAVVRVVEGASMVPSRMLPTKIPYKRGANLDWILPRLRKKCL